MFNWLWSLFRGKKEELSSDLYREEDTWIYKFFDGTKMVRADPIHLYKRMREVWADLTISLKVADSIHPDADKEHGKAIGKIHYIFGTRPVDQDGGISDVKALELLIEFNAYYQDIKKKAKPSPTTPLPMEASTPLPAVVPPTPSSSDSGSTVNVPSTAVPDPSLTELLLPHRD